MKRIFAVGLLATLLALLVGGCNLFSFTAPSDSSTDLVEEGRDALRDGDYSKAIEKFEEALNDDEYNAAAHWGIAKAYMRQTGFTSITIMSEVAGFQDGNLPFMSTPIDSANALYQGTIHANEHLKMIFDGQAVSSEYNAGSIALDYTGCLAIQGILLFRDTNGDQVIDANDFNLQAQLDALGDFQLDDNTWNNDLTPEQQQELLNTVTNVLTNSSTALDTFLTDLLSDSTVDLGFDTENLDDVINNIMDGFNNNYGGGGGGGLASFGGASHLKSFNEGGNR